MHTGFALMRRTGTNNVATHEEVHLTASFTLLNVLRECIHFRRLKRHTGWQLAREQSRGKGQNAEPRDSECWQTELEAGKSGISATWSFASIPTTKKTTNTPTRLGASEGACTHRIRLGRPRQKMQRGRSINAREKARGAGGGGDGKCGNLRNDEKNSPLLRAGHFAVKTQDRQPALKLSHHVRLHAARNLRCSDEQATITAAKPRKKKVEKKEKQKC